MSCATGAVQLGAEVRRRREAQGLTLVTLGERSGLTPNYIGLIELGRKDPSISTILALAKGLGACAAELVGGSGEISPAGREVAFLFGAASPDVQEAIIKLLLALARLGAKKPHH